MTPVDSRQCDARVSNGRTLVRLGGARDAGARVNARPGRKGVWAVTPLPQWDPAGAAPGLVTVGRDAFDRFRKSGLTAGALK